MEADRLPRYPNVLLMQGALFINENFLATANSQLNYNDQRRGLQANIYLYGSHPEGLKKISRHSLPL